MKAIKYILLLATLFVFIQCDTIDDENKLRNGDTPVDPNPNPNPNPDPNPAVPDKVVRKLLVEEFTGHKCVNCPRAHELLGEIVEKNEGKIIVMAIHSGFFAKSDGEFVTDFTTPEGDEVANKFNSMGLAPKIMVSRQNKGETLSDSACEPIINKMLQETPFADAYIKLTPKYDDASAKFTAKVDVQFLNKVQGAYQLCVALMESDIVAPQKKEGQTIHDYKHKHVLRAMLNGAWGELVTDTPELKKNYSFSYEKTLDAKWKPENMIAVAYIFNRDTEEIIQAEEVHLK